MTTTVSSTIGSAGGRDYSSITGWLAGAPANLVTADQVWKGLYYADSELTGGAITLTSTTDATRYFWLRPATGQGFNENASKLTNALRYNASNGAAYKSTSHGQNLYFGNAHHFLCEDMQFWHAANVGALSAQTNSTWVRCILKQTSTLSFNDANSTGKFKNCLFQQASTTFSGTVLGGPQEAYNCTVIRPTDLTTGGNGAINSHANYPLIKNTVVLGALTTMFGGTLGSYQATTGYNASSVGTGSMPGSNNVGSLTASSELTDVAAATLDVRPKATSNLVAGTRDATNTGDLDILLQARSTTTPTIGCMEYVAPAPTPTTTDSVTVADAVTPNLLLMPKVDN